MRSSKPRLAGALVVVAAGALALTACSGNSGGSSSSGGGGTTTISLLTDNTPTTVTTVKAVVAAFEKANPKIKVDASTRPAGTTGDNLVKTKLSTGDMADVFWYNSGSLFQALAPAKNLVDLTNDPAVANVDKSFLPVVSDGGKVYGTPQGSSFGGGILYNKEVYDKLGLQVPKTWSDFIANSDKIKAAGITAVEGSFKAPDTWTTQLFVLADYYNVQKTDPTFAADYTANKAKYASTPAALAGFQKLEDVTKKGYYQKGAGSTTFAQAIAALAAGKAAQYPMLGFAIAGLPAAQTANIGFFGIPGDDAASAGATVWEPAGQYIPLKSKHIAEAKKFLAFVASPAGTAIQAKAVPPTGPYLVTGSTLPANAPQAAKDLQAYLDAKATSPALEFLSPVKGPSLEQITTAVATGQTSADKAASQYDSDVTKQAKQLGLPGW